MESNRNIEKREPPWTAERHALLNRSSEM